ncbi:MAG: M20 family metallopeptidase [Gordonia sp. (in: high G+C Gram-positive bacteria)]
MTDVPAPLAQARAAVADAVRRRFDDLTSLSHELHDDPEVAWQETRAAARVSDLLLQNGFAVSDGAYGIDTAVEATSGHGDLTVTIAAEYDALPGLGHACGHNTMAAMSVGAAIALATVADDAGLRVKLLGTPAEERGGGKIALLKAGAWEDCDFSLMVHAMGGVDVPAGAFAYTAVDRFDVTFTGRASHAAAAPQAGINALSAVTVTLTALGLLRQELPPGVNLNPIVIDGGTVTNVIPEHAVVGMEVRAASLHDWRQAKKRVLDCFQAGATASGCEWSWEAVEPPYAPVQNDPMLSELWNENLRATGRTLFDVQLGGGSTDMGNVTQVVPGLHPTIAYVGEHVVPHTAAFTPSTVSPAADQAIVDAATSMAWTVLDVALDPERRKHFQDRRAARTPGSTTVTLEA